MEVAENAVKEEVYTLTLTFMINSIIRNLGELYSYFYQSQSMNFKSNI